MTNDLSAFAEQFLEIAKISGAEAADVLVVDGTTLSIEVLNQELEHAERSEGVDLGLRVFVDGRQATVSVSDTSRDVMSAAAERAVAMAKEAPVDPYAGLAEPDQLAKDWDADALKLFDPAEPLSPEAYKELAVRAEAATLAVDGVSQAQGASAGNSQTEVFLATSKGFGGGYRRSSSSVSCVAIAGEGLGMERDWSGESRSHFADLPSPEEIGTQAGERAAQKLGAKQPPTGAYPVLFDERISSSLIGHFVGAINGMSIARGSSWLADALGEQVLPKGLDLVEDPTRVSVAGSKPFDGEGLPVAKRHLVKDGVLQGWTLDLATARQLGLQSTGNAARGVSGPPSPTTGNLDLTQGSKTKQDLMDEMGTGLLITSMIGSTINPNTGDYSRGASGFWVENGQITGPVNECTVAGNLRDFLMRIVPANDARQHLSRRVPSLLLEGLTIAGS